MDKENEKRIKNNIKKYPIIFIVNEEKSNNKNNNEYYDEFEDINKFEDTATS